MPRRLRRGSVRCAAPLALEDEEPARGAAKPRPPQRERRLWKRSAANISSAIAISSRSASPGSLSARAAEEGFQRIVNHGAASRGPIAIERIERLQPKYRDRAAMSRFP
jgi:hypothetical protein